VAIVRLQAVVSAAIHQHVLDHPALRGFLVLIGDGIGVTAGQQCAADRVVDVLLALSEGAIGLGLLFDLLRDAVSCSNERLADHRHLVALGLALRAGAAAAAAGTGAAAASARSMAARSRRCGGAAHSRFATHTATTAARYSRTRTARAERAAHSERSALGNRTTAAACRANVARTTAARRWSGDTAAGPGRSTGGLGARSACGRASGTAGRIAIVGTTGRRAHEENA